MIMISDAYWCWCLIWPQLLRGRVISAADEALATSKSTLMGTALKLVMGEYSSE